MNIENYVWMNYVKNYSKNLYVIRTSQNAVESQAFYKALGCVEAELYNEEHVETEPYDCQLECVL